MNEHDEILTEKQAAAFLKIAPQSLRCQRAGNTKPNGMPLIPVSYTHLTLPTSDLV